MLSSKASLILVAAPAGYGKTSFLRRLDERWRDSGVEVSWLDGSGDLPTRPIEGTVTIIDGPASFDPGPIGVFLKQSAGTGARCVVATRFLPPLDRLDEYSDGRVLIVNPDDLRLTIDETALFLDHFAPGQTDVASADWLHRETGGWVALIETLASLGLHWQDERSDRRQTGLSASIAATSIGRTVESGLPDDIIKFLSQVAVLDLLSRELIDDVLGSKFVHSFLRCRDELLLLIPSEQRGMFEIAPVIRNYLREIHPMSSEQRDALLLKASRWHLENDAPDITIDYLLRARRPDEATAIFAQHGAQFRNRTGDNLRMLQWLDRIILLGGRLTPDLQLWRVWGLIYALRLQEAEDILEAITPELDPESYSSLAFAQRLRISIASRRGEVDQTEHLAEAWLARWSEIDARQASGVAMMLALVHAYRQDDRPSRRMLLVSRQFAVHTGNDAANLWSMAMEALVELQAGRTEFALDIIERALSIAARIGGGSSPVSKMLSVVAALIHLELDDRDAVRHALAHGYSITPRYGLTETHLAAQEAMAGLTEQTAGANAALLSIHQEGISGWRYAQTGHLLAVRILVRAGRVEEARARFEAVRDAALHPDDLRSQQELLSAEAWIRFAERDYPGARELLLPLVAFADSHGQRRWLTSLLLLRSACEWRLGEMRSAQRCFSRGIGIASSGQMMRTVLDMGWAVRELVAHMAEEDISPQSDQFLRSLRERLSIASPEPEIVAPLEQLTKREHEVLELLDGGMRASDMANRLGMSLCTFKWHVRNVYGKLAVRNRSGAVAAARRFGLI